MAVASRRSVTLSESIGGILQLVQSINTIKSLTPYKMPTPDFMIIGAMKCATSTLHVQLALQSGFVMSDPKEPNFFSNDEIYAQGLDWYYSLFAAATSGDLCGESSTHYTKLPTFPNTVSRIKQHVPHVKVIYVMRHPIDRLVSQFIHEWSQHTVNTKDINEAIDQCPILTQYSQYSMQIRPYLETFGPDNVLAVFSNNLRHHPQRELERVCNFLGYAGTPVWQDDAGEQHLSSARMRHSAWRDALVNQPILEALRRSLVPTSVRTWVKGLWQMKERPQLSPETHAKLAHLFDTDLAILGQWLGVELNCRNFNEVTEYGPDRFLNWPSAQRTEQPIAR